MGLPTQNGGYWFGNEKAGLQYCWQSNKGWVLAGEFGKMIPVKDEVVLSMPFIQKTVDLAKERTIGLGWAITPAKPVRKDWRHVALHRGVACSWSIDYTAISPDYAVPHEKKETYDLMRHRLEKETEQWPINCFYWFGGPSMWTGSPEYADWWREWAAGRSPVHPDLNSGRAGTVRRVATHRARNFSFTCWKSTSRSIRKRASISTAWEIPVAATRRTAAAMWTTTGSASPKTRCLRTGVTTNASTMSSKLAIPSTAGCGTMTGG